MPPDLADLTEWVALVLVVLTIALAVTGAEALVRAIAGCWR